jgi:hypothetical protein
VTYFGERLTLAHDLVQRLFKPTQQLTANDLALPFLFGSQLLSFGDRVRFVILRNLMTERLRKSGFA